jgi:hypothetical protein
MVTSTHTITVEQEYLVPVSAVLVGVVTRLTSNLDRNSSIAALSPDKNWGFAAIAPDQVYR